ncbi:MAG: DUF4136 domain-containing protein [Gammaproteobacteria bacterium]|jgi:hypothetical protein
MIRALPLALFVLLITGCTSAPVGYSDFDQETDFTGFRSFAWVPTRTLVSAAPNPVNPALEPALKEETRAYLTSRGFTYVSAPEQADFVIGFAVGGTPTVRSTSFTDNYRQVQIVGASRNAEVVTQESTEGGLVIDFYDAQSGQKKWMGWSLMEITMSDRVNLQPTVRQLVAIILQHFPP